MTVLIRNVLCFLPGADEPARRDIFISGDRISAVGSFPKKTADTVIDGQGAYAAPGFIDAYNVSDHYLTFAEPGGWDAFAASGVTTAVAGHDGVSLAPFHANAPLLWRWSDVRGVNFSWHTMKDCLRFMGARRLPVNFTTAVGTISSSPEFSKFSDRRAVKKNELLFGILSYALRSGAAGVSVDLTREGVMFFNDPFARRTGELLARADKVLSVRLDEQREVEAQFQTAAAFAEKTGCPMLLSHFDGAATLNRRAEVADAFEKRCGGNGNIFLDLGLPTVGLYEARRFLPEWVFGNGDVEAQLGDEWTVRRITADMHAPPGKMFVARAPGHEKYTGLTLAEVMERLEAKTEKETILHLLRATSLRASLFFAREEVSLDELKHPRVILGTHFAGIFHPLHAGLVGPSASSNLYRPFLQKAAEEGMSSLSLAVRALTVRPAGLFRLKNRGEIREGAFADLTIFGDGVKYTLVNGAVTYDGERVARSGAGRALAL